MLFVVWLKSNYVVLRAEAEGNLGVLTVKKLKINRHQELPKSVK